MFENCACIQYVCTDYKTVEYARDMCPGVHARLARVGSTETEGEKLGKECHCSDDGRLQGRCRICAVEGLQIKKQDQDDGSSAKKQRGL